MVNEVVVLDSDGGQDVVVSGPDFVSDPRWSPDGDSLAWLEWDHPAMPWDSSTLKVQNAMGVLTVAGGVDEGGEGICQPRWAPDGSLWFCSDRDDWWSLYRWTPESGVELVFGEPGEVGAPQWVFGLSRFAFLDDGRAVLAVRHEGRDSLRLLGLDGSATPLEIGATEAPTLAASGDTVVLVGSSPVEEPGVRRFRIDPSSAEPGPVETLSPVRELGIGSEWFSEPELIEFPGGDGRPTYANFYRPTNPTAAPLDGELPPLIVTGHGGPTSNAVSTLSLAMQFWTTRGIAVVDVDYGGSTGFGRAYRDRLQGEWGLLDVGDCISVARWLGDQGRVDPERAVIRGGSASGLTVLMALATSDVFAGGADYFGVADAEALAQETHKFESRYLDGLIAPYPEGRDVYRERSPLTHLASLSAPLVVLQGAEDQVVPPAQSEAVVASLREKGLPVAYRLYAGEQHGFRRAENIKDSLQAELSFYAQVLGFELPADEADPGPRHREPGRHRRQTLTSSSSSARWRGAGACRCGRTSCSPSTSTLGSRRSSQRGSHQAFSPMRYISAGISAIRITNASRKTAIARAKPIDLMIGSSIRMNAPNTEIMMTAAAATTRALLRNPSTTASRVVAPCTCASRIRVTRKTW